MWIVAIGWSYVVILMAATETSVIAGIMTFLLYCMIPLSILFYLTGGKHRRERRLYRERMAANAAHEAQAAQDAEKPPAPPADAGQN
jgi:ABC-type transport system involved in cytochrome bd biosynthesis fused ATPase/permease subunit